MATYSYSRLTCFENCPLQFKFKYIDRIKVEPEAEGIEAFMGIRVHKTLEKLYRDKKMNKESTLEHILEYYEMIWKKNWHENVKIVKKEYNEKNYFKTGQKCIADYYKRYEPFDQERTIALEQRLLFDIEEYKIQGFIDRLSQKEDGTYVIRDYKTNATLPTQAIVDENRQLALYNIGIRTMWDDADKTELVWHYLAFDKEMKSVKTEGQLEQVKNNVVSLIQGIETAQEMDNFHVKESGLCKYCEFQDLCPNYKHIYKTEQMTINKFFKDNGVRLVNNYRDLSEQKKFIEKEIKELKEAIVKYAIDNELEIVRGSDRKLRVKVKDERDIPTKTSYPQEYEQLEVLLKGSEYWEDVSTINAPLLRNVLKSGSISTDFQKKIAKLLIDRHSESIRMSKLSDEKE